MCYSKLEDYVVLETIGKGEFGLRQKVSRLSDNSKFEWQEICYRFLDDNVKEVIVNEINILKKLQHPNIVHYEDQIVKREASMLYLIMECSWNDNLQNLIERHQRMCEFIAEDIIWAVLYQMSDVLNSLTSLQDPYTNKVLHRCLQPSSILFSEETLKIKIADFGVGSITKPFYRCPESMSSGILNEKTDVWSLGCIIYELCTLQKPFESFKTEELESAGWRTDCLPNNYSRELGSILRFILTPDCNTRPSALMILHHPIMKSKKNFKPKKNISDSDKDSGVLETDFPLQNEMTVTINDSLKFSEPYVFSDLSLNHYLSMIGDEDESLLDDVDIHSIENGTALPKATSSILQASQYVSPAKAFQTMNLGSKTEQLRSREMQELSRDRSTELHQMEIHLQRWAKMLEEKEQELSHKERRLILWETQLQEIQLSQQQASSSSGLTIKNDGKPISMLPQQRYQPSECSDFETDADSTLSAYPGDSFLLPTVVKLEPSKIRNPFTRYNFDKRVRFHDDGRHETQNDTHPIGFREQRLQWLEMKKKKHLAAIPTLPEKAETDYIVMEEKSISSSHHRWQVGPPTSAPRPPKLPSTRKLPIMLTEKENVKEDVLSEKPKSCRIARSSQKIVDSKILSSELRAKLKSHNLPGLR